jgi:hypothetical protein
VSDGNAYQAWMCDSCDRQIANVGHFFMQCTCGANYEAETGERIWPVEEERVCGLCHPSPDSGPSDLCPEHAAEFRAWAARDR